MSKPSSIYFLFCLVNLACIFDTRDPEPPSQSSSNYTPPTEPSIVFTNLTTAFRDLNTLNYLKSFADSTTAGRNFSFEPTSQARLKYGAFFNWTKQSEQQYFENMKSKVQSGSSASLSLESLTAQSLQSDSAQYEATYRITVQHSVATVSKEASGKVQFFLIANRSSGYWYIWRWVDVPNTANSFSWSDLKGEFAQ